MLFILMVAFTGGISMNVSQNFYSSSWAGTETGSVAWMFRSEVGWDRNLTTCLTLTDNFKAAYGQTYSQSKETGKWLPPEKSADRLENETILKLVKGWELDPFSSLTFQSQFYDNAVQDSSLYLNPITLTLSTGASRTILKKEKTEILSRLGFAVKRNIDRRSKSSTDGGIQWITEAKSKLADGISYTGRLVLYKALFSSNPDSLNKWKSPDVELENTLTITPLKFLQVMLHTRFIYDKEKSSSIQVEEVLSLGLNIPL